MRYVIDTNVAPATFDLAPGRGRPATFPLEYLRNKHDSFSVLRRDVRGLIKAIKRLPESERGKFVLGVDAKRVCRCWRVAS